MTMVSFCQEAAAALENERIDTYLTELCDATFTQLGDIETLFAAEYPDLDPLDSGMKDGEDQAEAKDDEPAEGEGKDGEEAAEDKDESVEEKPADAKSKGRKTDAEEAPEQKGVRGKSYHGGVKRFTKSQGNTIRECSETLGEMADAENLDRQQKLACKFYAKELAGMVEEPAAAVEASDELEQLPPEQKRLVLAKLKRLELLVAHKRRLARMKSLRGR